MRPLLGLTLVSALGLEAGIVRAEEAGGDGVRSECELLTATDLAEVEARFRSAYLVRGAPMPAFVLRCDDASIRLEAAAEGLSALRSDERIAEQFVGLLARFFEVSGEAVPTPVAVGVVAASPAIEKPTEVGGLAPATVPREPDAPSALRDGEKDATPQKSPKNGPGASALARPLRSSLVIESGFVVWATELPGALGGRVGWHSAPRPWAFGAHLGGFVSVEERASLRPFELVLDVGATFAPRRWFHVELGAVMSLLGVPPPDTGQAPFGSSLRPGAYLAVLFQQPSRFGALYVGASVRAVVASREVLVGETVVETIPAVTPLISAGAEFDL